MVGNMKWSQGASSIFVLEESLLDKFCKREENPGNEKTER